MPALKRLSAVLLFAGCVAPLMAQSPTVSATSYFHDAVLADLSTQSTGQLCTSTTLTTPAQSSVNPSTATKAETCGETHTRVYTLHLDDVTYTIKPADHGAPAHARRAALAIGTLGYGSRLVSPADILKDQTPGIHLLARAENSGLTLKLGSRTAYYAILRAEPAVTR